MKVVFFQRNPGTKLFSIEILFKSIRNSLPSFIEATTIVSSKVNSGITKKLYNILEVLFRPQGDINHVTGDVHYLTFFLRKNKTILTIHDINLMYSTNALKKTVHRWFWLKIPMYRSGMVTVISQTTKNELLKYVDYPEEKIRVIYNCISPHFTPHPKAFTKSKPVLLQIGVKPNKNLSRLIPALEGISCTLRIVGQPSPDMLALLEKHKIDYSWKSNLTDEEVLQEYIQSDMLVFVSTFEGFGLPIVEANMVERPVVTSNVSSMPEIADNAACLVDPFDISSIRKGILRVIEDDEYREQLLENGRVNRERFTPQSIAHLYSELYIEMYANRLEQLHEAIA
ncbi:glycosyltransferase family 1 protein [Cytophagaceae bacterium DM2B3-1]|uniref:Glycosyltransferase family 1 protein n=1 Tax=Xanthocytophaga flava TaxID=3048013 RepID=A0ABT7CWH1_9BACT|nr:glycosyltransferase family 1 protein [Xanthocytophaga flavus]MDJ1466999.1 glycosyltransferase family 1 protein [Xanthocytophaga flavus]MDJ1498106.1 glycosyltransferase family 1 protein [Xanthocytophaga flavus]